MVTALLLEPHSEPVTLNVDAFPETVVPTPSVMLGSALVLPMVQVTLSVTLWLPVTPLKVAVAVKYRDEPPVTLALLPPVPPLVVLTTNCMFWTVGQTFTVCAELLTAPSDALTLVVPGRVSPRDCRLAAASNPGAVKLATPGLEELQTDWPVTVFVLPSL